MDILYWIGTNIIGQPAVLLGIVVLVGLLLQRKPVEDVVVETARVMIGVYVSGC